MEAEVLDEFLAGRALTGNHLAPAGPEQIFSNEDADRLVDALERLRQWAGVAPGADTDPSDCA